MSTSRGYFLKGVGEQLNRALLNYAIDFLVQRGYTSIEPPLLMREQTMSKAADIAEYEEKLYSVGVGDKERSLRLIATSEQPLAALHAGEWIAKNSLPIRYAGISKCFRPESGSSGRDVHGLFRVHQFDKVEQFCITHKKASWEEHRAMLQISQDFYQSLEIPFRVVEVVSGLCPRLVLSD